MFATALSHQTVIRVTRSEKFFLLNLGGQVVSVFQRAGARTHIFSWVGEGG